MVSEVPTPPEGFDLGPKTLIGIGGFSGRKTDESSGNVGEEFEGVEDWNPGDRVALDKTYLEKILGEGGQAPDQKESEVSIKRVGPSMFEVTPPEGEPVVPDSGKKEEFQVRKEDNKRKGHFDIESLPEDWKVYFQNLGLGNHEDLNRILKLWNTDVEKKDALNFNLDDLGVLNRLQAELRGSNINNYSDFEKAFSGYFKFAGTEGRSQEPKGEVGHFSAEDREKIKTSILLPVSKEIEGFLKGKQEGYALRNDWNAWVKYNIIDQINIGSGTRGEGESLLDKETVREAILKKADEYGGREQANKEFDDAWPVIKIYCTTGGGGGTYQVPIRRPSAGFTTGGEVFPVVTPNRSGKTQVIDRDQTTVIDTGKKGVIRRFFGRKNKE